MYSLRITKNEYVYKEIEYILELLPKVSNLARHL